MDIKPAAVNVLCFEALKRNPNTMVYMDIYFKKKSINLELWRYQNKRLKWYFEVKQDQPFVFMERHSWVITSLN